MADNRFARSQFSIDADNQCFHYVVRDKARDTKVDIGLITNVSMSKVSSHVDSHHSVQLTVLNQEGTSSVCCFDVELLKIEKTTLAKMNEKGTEWKTATTKKKQGVFWLS